MSIKVYRSKAIYNWSGLNKRKVRDYSKAFKDRTGISLSRTFHFLKAISLCRVTQLKNGQLSSNRFFFILNLKIQSFCKSKSFITAAIFLSALKECFRLIQSIGIVLIYNLLYANILFFFIFSRCSYDSQRNKIILVKSKLRFWKKYLLLG